jgi:TRAP-type C4-dicarboxylate transport system permease large subunit
MVSLGWVLFSALFFPAFLTYFVQHIVCSFFYKTQNLKKRYNAEWALVTGSSSGEWLFCLYQSRVLR